mmetsp:Transcript_11720/g.14269  ORF Transcript_11720/g.14269 Transcript_11720/m.14269 type:complete len:194 (+) Transcript_11720:110-691(+)
MDAGLVAQLAALIQNQRANALHSMPISCDSNTMCSMGPYLPPVTSSIPETCSSLEGYPCNLRPPPGLEHVTPVPPKGAGPKARQISKSSMSTADSEVEQMDDHEELESNASGAEGSAMALPGDMSMIARSWDSALRELLHSVPRLARDAKGAPLLAQHINSMDMQGLTLLDHFLHHEIAVHVPRAVKHLALEF